MTMRRAVIPALLLCVPGMVIAADRQIPLGSFDRIRVEGPYKVQVLAGRSPRATVSGAADALDGVEIRVDGRSLVVRKARDTLGAGWGPRRATPVAVTVSALTVNAVSAMAGSVVTVSAVKGDRVDLSVGGPGSIAVESAQATQLTATVIGPGAISVGGRADRARLTSSGTGTIDAEALEAGDLIARLDGAGEIRARSRYTATIANMGLGQVTVAGRPKCRVDAPGGGTVTCGAAR
ncbi:GIN domain-containing protein [Sphingomonas sp.]|uniref:GIN domain-containing protein n=1 Tax=Sphingomonas sp. TaxID=28214 RepID=UPI0035B30E40